MFNVTETPDEQKWINYSEDEKYLIRYISNDTIQKFIEKENIKVKELMDFVVIGWEGIFKKKNDKIRPLECNIDNKLLVFNMSPDRWSFVLAKSRDFNTFFDMEKYLKN